MMSTAPRISVVAATHNRRARLAALLESLRAQTLPLEHFEVIVVDDGSTDDTGALLARAHERDDLRLRVVRRPVAGGPAVARNAGWRAARAPIVAFTDDDCIVAPTWLEAALTACAANPGAVVQGRVDPIPAETHLEGPYARTLRVHGAGPFFQTCNIFYPRTLLERLGGFDERFPQPGGEDTDLGWRAKERGEAVAYAPDALAYHAVSVLGARGRLRVAARWSHSMLVYKRHPQLRREVFFRGVFYRPQHYWLLRALLALLLPRRLRHLRLYLAGPYVVVTLKRVRHEGGSARHAPLFVAEDLVELWGMVRASIRNRMLVL